MRRVMVIGTTGSGKTTLAVRLARALGVPHAEMDEWNNQPNWVEPSLNDFRAAVEHFTRQDGWVMDGNYSKARDISWSRADTLVWLDYPAPVVLLRLFRRGLRRVYRREVLWNGNRETLVGQYSLYSLFLKSHWRFRRDLPALSRQYAHLRVIHLTSPRQTEAWLRRQEADTAHAPQPPPA